MTKGFIDFRVLCKLFIWLVMRKTKRCKREQKKTIARLTITVINGLTLSGPKKKGIYEANKHIAYQTTNLKSNVTYLKLFSP